MKYVPPPGNGGVHTINVHEIVNLRIIDVIVKNTIHYCRNETKIPRRSSMRLES